MLVFLLKDGENGRKSQAIQYIRVIGKHRRAVGVAGRLGGNFKRDFKRSRYELYFHCAHVPCETKYDVVGISP
jgi:hypothetical protein